MKAEIYIFGNFAGGYSQYPDNYTHVLFKSVSDTRKGASEIVYHREGSLTYYIYLREVSQSANTFIALCYVFNDVIIRDFSCLFGVFEDAVTNIVVKGDLLEFTDNGGLSTKVNVLYAYPEELQRIADFLNGQLSSLWKHAEKLPPSNYAVPTSEWKSFSYNEVSLIHEAIKKYANIRVIKGESYDTETMKGYAAKLKKQDDKIHVLQCDVEKLKEENTRLNRKKKQFLTVIILVSLLLIGGGITAFIISDQNSDINSKRIEIEQLKETNTSLNSQIEQLNEDIDQWEYEYNIEHNNYVKYKNGYDTLTDSYEMLKFNYEVLEFDYNTLVSSIKERQPFFITQTSFDFNSGRFAFDYYGLKEGSYNILINVYADNGNRVRSSNYNASFYEGFGSKEFYISNTLSSGNWYYFEVCVDKVIVGGRKH